MCNVHILVISTSVGGKLELTVPSVTLQKKNNMHCFENTGKRKKTVCVNSGLGDNCMIACHSHTYTPTHPPMYTHRAHKMAVNALVTKSDIRQ